MNIEKLKSNKSFDGETVYFQHQSKITKTPMRFSCFIPGKKKVKNAIIWLSGLTCTEENFVSKAGSQSLLADSDTMIVCPDTSPRGLDLPNEHDSYDFGSGAGFYVNATTDRYDEHYKMYDYIAKEIVSVLKNEFAIEKISIMGHSMGGHGALVLGLREQELFQSVSAFSPIVNPTKCPWGEKALCGYLGEDKVLRKSYDATELVMAGKTRPEEILIDQGLEDEFLENELLTENLMKAAEENGQKLKVNFREGYDHSYYFISTFLKEHIDFHLNALK